MTKHTHRHVAARKRPQRSTLDLIVYFFTFATPLFELPQAIEIFSHHSAQDVSLLTWLFFCLDNIVWIAYALRRNIMPVLIGSIMYEIIEVTILIGVIMYG